MNGDVLTQAEVESLLSSMSSSGEAQAAMAWDARKSRSVNP